MAKIVHGDAQTSEGGVSELHASYIVQNYFELYTSDAGWVSSSSDRTGDR